MRVLVLDVRAYSILVTLFMVKFDATILGLLPFVIFFYDLPEYATSCFVHQYADDTVFIMEASNNMELDPNLCQLIVEADRWMAKHVESIRSGKAP